MYRLRLKQTAKHNKSKRPDNKPDGNISVLSLKDTPNNPQVEAASEMRKFVLANPDIIFTTAAKSHVTVTLDKNYYLNKMFLLDNKSYITIKKDPTKKLININLHSLLTR